MGNLVDEVAKSTIAPTSASKSDPKPTTPRHNERKRFNNSTFSARRRLPRLNSTESAPADSILFKKSKRNLDRRRGCANRRRRNSIKSIKSENATKYSTHIVEQMVSLGYGTEVECYQASALTPNYRDMDAVLEKLKQIQSRSVTCRNSNDQKIIASINKKSPNIPHIQANPMAFDDQPESHEDDFLTPTYDSFSVSEPVGDILTPNRSNAHHELRNSISATQPFYLIKKEELMQKQMRESIKSVLLSIEPEIDTDTKEETDIDVQTQLAVIAKEPPLLPAIPQNLLVWNDAQKDTQYAVCCTGQRMFHSGYTSGVYLYDLNGFDIGYLCAFPDNVYANSMGMAMDYKQNKLHLFGGKGLLPQWFILDIKAKLWDIRRDLSKYKLPFALNMEHVKCLLIDMNLHIYTKGRFFRYNRHKHRFIELNAIDGVQCVANMFYIEAERKIYVLGKDSNRIWYCEQMEYKWHELDITLPYNEQVHDYDAVLGFEHILFVFYHEKREVWCIDLVKQNKCICDKEVRIEGGLYSKMINTDQNIAHSLCMDHNGPIHVVISLHDILSSTSML